MCINLDKEISLFLPLKGLSRLADTPPSLPWRASSTSLLFALAGSAYLQLAHTAMALQRLGRALRYLRCSVICTGIVLNINYTPVRCAKYKPYSGKVW